jgi:hypothetical protein
MSSTPPILLVCFGISYPKRWDCKATLWDKPHWTQKGLVHIETNSNNIVNPTKKKLKKNWQFYCNASLEWHISHSLFIWSFSIQWTISKLKIVQMSGNFATSWTKSNDYLEFWKHPLIIYYDFGLYSYTPICLKMNNHFWRMHHVICREFNLVPKCQFS